MAGFVGAVLDDAVGGLGGGLTGLCSVLGILRGAGVVTAGFGWLTVVKPLGGEALVRVARLDTDRIGSRFGGCIKILVKFALLCCGLLRGVKIDLWS